MKLFTKQDYKQSTWSGGTTTQLYIYPTTSSYAERNFMFRISSATVDDPKSTFTLLPNITRYIMPLDTQFDLTHNGKAIHLDTHEIDCFSGGDLTECIGKGTDLNLMLNGVDGSMEHTIGKIEGDRLVFVYAYEPMTVTTNTQVFLAKGEMLLIEQQDFVVDKYCAIMRIK